MENEPIHKPTRTQIQAYENVTGLTGGLVTATSDHISAKNIATRFVNWVLGKTVEESVIKPDLDLSKEDMAKLDQKTKKILAEMGAGVAANSNVGSPPV